MIRKCKKREDREIITSHVFKKKEHKPPQSLWLAHEELLTSLSNEVNIYRRVTGNCYPPEMRKVQKKKIIQYKKIKNETVYVKPFGFILFHKCE